ncbi:SAM-dependent methyltransferase [Amycolatopsis rhabdoformis]|uniref:SAM-dependent methyltransferase n=1 Tax=Amycolatopsis rhabdoformis TaxID=1448059 RepID=A0ABZ1I1E2_9PSEU|nr:SAM-dependent methyltransferase [Amycolatopsis rhabdoformis]WSE27398.1 SAM-dependent methyltransferase [Amycolatopsis rhabdoformis]
MTRADEPFPPPGVDLGHPNVARIYDYYLGGTTNWEIDRQFADRILQAYPIIRPIAYANRMFLHRVVRHLVKRGIRQFVDIGSGVPTMGHAHEVAEDLAPGEVKVVYVDYEPVAVAHSRRVLSKHGDPRRHTVIHADMRDPQRLWSRVAETGIIDLTQPVAVLLIAVLHIQQPPAPGSGATEDLGPCLVKAYRDLLAPGSYLALSHVTDDGVPPGHLEMLADLKRWYNASSSPVVFRNHEQISGFFGDFTLLEPGVTWTPLWHPEEASDGDQTASLPSPNESLLLAGVARK